MRLSLCVLLVTLALCCYEANAKVCPALMAEVRSFFLEPEGFYKINLVKFFPPGELIEAAMKVKKWVDLMPFQDRAKLYNFAKSIQSQCNK
ncbi:secretoglobin family 1D member 2-like [Phyllostomus hastatus]|uniref:secretoglobin family 1D member 2-like n=1 Tax=Phyllostomus hastatus TaxID=9423 RepID=UPI001E67F95A|nr:secretoglobin family 1D member 2-like [Phyllostomus hastatus]